MTETPIPKLIVGLSLPTITSMLVTSIYNMADTFFVSKLGTSAAGAVGIVFSIMALIQSVGFMLGMGAGSNVSRLLGMQKKEEASTCASTAFFAALGFGLLLTLVGLSFQDGLMRILGATPTILPHAKAYAKYIFFGAPIMCASFTLNNILRSEGKAVLSMIGITLGGLLNIVLDPIFIFVLGFGTAGAAIATLISQCVSFSILVGSFLAGKSTSKLSIRRVSKQFRVWAAIAKTGFPSFCRQGLATIATVCLNVNTAPYGDAAVAAMSIVGRVFMFILSVLLGFGQGFQPVCGYNYGAKRYDRVKEAYRFSAGTGILLMLILSAAGFLFAPQVMAWFRKEDLQVISIGSFAFRAQCLVLPFQAITVISNMLFQSLGKHRQATFLACSRQGIFFLPLILILPRLFGLTGVQISQPLADLFTVCFCIPLLPPFFRELKELEQAKE